MQIDSSRSIQKFSQKSSIMKYFPFRFVPLEELDYLTFPLQTQLRRKINIESVMWFDERIIVYILYP